MTALKDDSANAAVPGGFMGRKARFSGFKTVPGAPIGTSPRIPRQGKNMTTKIKARKRTFRKGMKVVYPLHGEGKIVDLVEKKLPTGSMRFYQIQLEGQPDADVFVPLDAALNIGLRAPMKEGDVPKILSILKKKASEEKVELNWRTWKNRYEEQKRMLREGDVTGLASVVRNLHEFSKGRTFSSKELKQLYQYTFDQLTRELSEATRSSLDNAEKLVNKALGGAQAHKSDKNSDS
jgi:RNA polymerase-interacting CarD/CdnL/TRCF family regulator